MDALQRPDHQYTSFELAIEEAKTHFIQAQPENLFQFIEYQGENFHTIINKPLSVGVAYYPFEVTIIKKGENHAAIVTHQYGHIFKSSKMNLQTKVLENGYTYTQSHLHVYKASEVDELLKEDCVPVTLENGSYKYYQVNTSESYPQTRKHYYYPYPQGDTFIQDFKKKAQHKFFDLQP